MSVCLTVCPSENDDAHICDRASVKSSGTDITHTKLRRRRGPPMGGHF
jgi:hypothetical protein